MKTKDLLKLLEEEEIQQAIIRIVSSKQERSELMNPSSSPRESDSVEIGNVPSEETQRELSTLRSQLEQYKGLEQDNIHLQELNRKLENNKKQLQLEKTQLERTKSELEEKIEVVQNLFNQQKEELKKIQENYQILSDTNTEQERTIKSYEKELRMFLLYQSLGEDGKEILNSVLKGANCMDEFTVRGVGKPDIERLYDVISHRIMCRDYQYLEQLQEIYLYFIDL
ncbi:MAG: hypothetical protein R3Y54_08480 [Eubacteriales bacterium]